MNIKFNALANYVGQGYTITVGLLVTPLYLQYLGAEAFGLIGFFTLLQAWLSLLDMGLSPTFGRQIAYARGVGDNFGHLVKILKSFEFIFLFLALFVVLSSFLSGHWISRNWLNELNSGISNGNNAPSIFNKWKKYGKYEALTSKRTVSIRSINEQLPNNHSHMKLLETVFNYFKNEPTLFEYLAAEIYKMTDTKIIIDEITRGTVDGGRDAIGRIKLGLNEDPIFADFALEAKCYNPGLNNKKINTVGVKEVARLISRIRNRQFGILVTTSAVSKQAYEEVRSDNHPIIFLSGKDIINIFLEKGINNIKTLDQYLTENYKKSSK